MMAPSKQCMTNKPPTATETRIAIFSAPARRGTGSNTSLTLLSSPTLDQVPRGHESVPTDLGAAIAAAPAAGRMMRAPIRTGIRVANGSGLRVAERSVVLVE